jgi:peptide/nickel transport system substrate-binding protein
VTRIDPRSGSLRPIRVGNGPSALAAGEGGVWVVNRGDGTLSRIDPETSSVTWTDSVGRDPTAVAVGEGSVWVTGGDEGTVVHVDPDGPRVVEPRKTGSRPAAIAVAGGSVWVAADAPASAHRGGTLRALVPHSPGSLVTMDWLHPAAYTHWGSSQLGSLAYDGLLAYRRVEGAAGATLVGALATEVPEPSADRRTYVFTLRPGLRFSDGRPVRPEDVRASMERFLQATRGRPVQEQFPPFYAGIVGARACMSGTATCDLARGIETDAAARTVTVHLERPDAEFLHKLAILFAFVVPADSERRATTGPPPPGTGPYRIAEWDSERGGTFVRNPHYRSSPARPGGAGFADRIDVRLFDEPTVERQIAKVQRGDADFVVLANPFVSPLSARRLRAIVSQAPGRVHGDPAPTSDWMFFNVRKRPFDDIRVRQAINLAIDRARVVEVTGGPDVGQWTCQFLPQLYPGYEPYCPYTARPGPGRGWSAPDMERARRLIAASGRAGERVVVHVPDYRARLARYYARLLDQLGFRVTLRIQGWNEFDIYEADTPATTGLVQWGADYLAASNYFEPHWPCDAGAENIYRLCDRALDRQIARAVAAPQSDVAAWAAVDRAVVDLAPAVPLTTRRSAVLVSERVGNVRTHLQLFTLLDHMWVR